MELSAAVLQEIAASLPEQVNIFSNLGLTASALNDSAEDMENTVNRFEIAT